MSGKAARRSLASRSTTFAPPVGFVLPRKNIPPDLPIQEDQLAVYAERRPQLGILDAKLQAAQKSVVPFRNMNGQFRHRERTSITEAAAMATHRCFTESR